MNCFTYGCRHPADAVSCRVLPKMISKLNNSFNFNQCTYELSRQKEKTARAFVFKNFNVLNCLTLEVSFYGFRKDNKVIEFN